MNDSDLLGELRIDRTQREDHGGGARGKRGWTLAALAAILIASGFGAWALIARRAVTVQTAAAISPAADRDAGAVLQATGYVTARRRATVSAQITGTLTAVLIEEGDKVHEGQVLARLDDSGYRAALQAAKAQAAAAHALVAQYQAQLEQDLRDAERDQSLAKQGLLSKQSAEQSSTVVDTARAQLLAQQKQVGAAEAAARQAQVNFDYTVVRAPFGGVITTKDAQVGEIVSPFSAGGGYTRTGIGTIVDMNSLEIDVDVNEAYIGRVHPGMPAEAVLDAYPDWHIPARVIAIVPTADRGKATIKVRVSIEHKDPRIVPDMGVRVTFLESGAATSARSLRGVLVPANAIVQRAGRTVVFVVEGERAHERTVHPSAQTYGDLRLLPADVSAGELVVAGPPAGLRDGERVVATRAASS
ncbi:MAG: efflux RND transporter periplasmic adaptor subunit [Gammaproteobacteria bacterium]|nr:efflux RND transporter periplasmic adaptor subunit [Gammaproteobacteria bacterium]